jgi:hypothetical protein
MGRNMDFLKIIVHELISQQLPYYTPQGSIIKGVNNQYWLIFRHRDAIILDKSLTVATPLTEFKRQYASHRLLRIDPDEANIYIYTPRHGSEIPTPTLLRTTSLDVVSCFLKLESVRKEMLLLEDSFRGVQNIRRGYNFPELFTPYTQIITELMGRSVAYRRFSHGFNSGVLSFYEEPLQRIIQSNGKIRVLINWQEFTGYGGKSAIEWLEGSQEHILYVVHTLQNILRELDEETFSSIVKVAELIRLDFLQIRLVNVSKLWRIHHQAIGIFSDQKGNHVLFEETDNDSLRSQVQNLDTISFLFSWEPIDQMAIAQKIHEFDVTWQQANLPIDFSQEFVHQVSQEFRRRSNLKYPQIKSVSQNILPPGTTVRVYFQGERLDQVERVLITNDSLIEIKVVQQISNTIAADITISPDHPPRKINSLNLINQAGIEHTVLLKHPFQIYQVSSLPSFEEVEGFQRAIEILLSGQHGSPNDFLYWLVQQRPRQFRVAGSSWLNEQIDQGLLFEHQKSGAQHCLRVMQDFGVAVCLDSIGLGKTQLATAVAHLFQKQQKLAKIAIIATQKRHAHWEKEMRKFGFSQHDYEIYHKNLVSRTSSLMRDCNHNGGPGLIIIDEFSEDTLRSNNPLHKLCLKIQDHDRAIGRRRYFLLLATQWNNYCEDLCNLLRLFLSFPRDSVKADLPPTIMAWLENQEKQDECLIPPSETLRYIHREIFLQRTRQTIHDAMPNLKLFAKRQAELLTVNFEDTTEQAFEQIFTQFEKHLFFPFVDPIRYLIGSFDQHPQLLQSHRLFLQRAESSMYALKCTIFTFSKKVEEMRHRLSQVSPNAEGLRQFLLLHYGFISQSLPSSDSLPSYRQEGNADDFAFGVDEDALTEPIKQQHTLLRRIDQITAQLQLDPHRARQIYTLMWYSCNADSAQLEKVQNLLADEFSKDHKRKVVTQKVKELVTQGYKVLLISTFSDTVVDYYHYMVLDHEIKEYGIGMVMRREQRYIFPDSYAEQWVQVSSSHAVVAGQSYADLKPQELFRWFARMATCRDSGDCPSINQEINVLIGTEAFLSDQNLEDADYLVNIDFPWDPMKLEQRIGRIDRPKRHSCETIHVYYASSVHQLFRLADTLNRFNQVKLDAETSGSSKRNLITLASQDQKKKTYSKTQFEDTILRNYIKFIYSLAQVKQQNQKSFQEAYYEQLDATTNLYTQEDLTFVEDISERLKALGDDYLANPITLGQSTGEQGEPLGLAALTIRYFDSNGKSIPHEKELILWNDQTGEYKAFGAALTTAFRTPVAKEIVPVLRLQEFAQLLYSHLVALKQQRMRELCSSNTIENLSIDGTLQPSMLTVSLDALLIRV